MRGSPRAPGFSCEQSASIPLILQEPADFTCTQPRDPPPHRFYMPISWQRENIFGTSGESNQVFCGGSSTSQPPCYILRVCYKFHRFFDATPPQSRNNLGYTLLSSHCTRHFSLPHHAPIFSRIHPLDGQGRHIWRIVRSRVQSPVSRVQCLTPASRVQEFRYAFCLEHCNDDRMRVIIKLNQTF